IQPILAHRASWCRLLRRCGDRKSSCCAAEKSNELAPFHRCLPSVADFSLVPRCRTAQWLLRARGFGCSACISCKSYTLRRCSKRVSGRCDGPNRPQPPFHCDRVILRTRGQTFTTGRGIGQRLAKSKRFEVRPSLQPLLAKGYPIPRLLPISAAPDKRS